MSAVLVSLLQSVLLIHCASGARQPAVDGCLAVVEPLRILLACGSHQQPYQLAATSVAVSNAGEC